MHALVLVANVLALHVTQAPLVLDGCNTASAQRAAAIGAMSPEDPATLASIEDLLGAPDGATCLMESWTLVRVYHAQHGSELIARTLVAGLASEEAHIAARAARLVRVLGVGDALAFAAIVHRPEMTAGAWQALRRDIAGMPESARKEALAVAAPPTLTSQAR